MYLFDTPSLERALDLPLDLTLRRLLHQRIDHLNALDFDVRNTTYFLVVEANASMDDITDELGWSPLTTPVDYLIDHGGWFELMVTAGNVAVFTLLIEDADGASDELIAMCRDLNVYK